MKIWKYQMLERDCFLELPRGARILSCQLQNKILCLWCLVDENQAVLEDRHFVAVGTGYDLPYPAVLMRFITTVPLDGIVHHIFEVHEIAAGHTHTLTAALTA